LVLGRVLGRESSIITVLITASIPGIERAEGAAPIQKRRLLLVIRRV